MPAFRVSSGRRRATAIGLLLSAIPSAVFAQVAPPPPVVEQSVPNRDQIELPRPAPDQTSPRIRIESSRAVEAAPCPLKDYDLKVDINRIDFSGNGGTALPPRIIELLEPVRAPAGGTRSITVVCDIRDDATARLRAAGFVASVQIPPQTIGSGTLKLEVIVARIVEVRVFGDAPPYRSTIAARVAQLKALDPLNERDAERILLTAGDIPGLDVQLALRPAGTVPGEVIGDLTIVYRRYSLLANVNNLGSSALGRESAYLRGEIYGLTGASDVTYVGGSSTFDFREQKVAQVGHLMGLGNGGSVIEGSFLYAWSRPDIGTIDIRSRTLIGNLSLSTPLLRSRQNSALLTGGLEIIEQRTRVHSAGTSFALNRDKLRVAFLRADVGHRDFLTNGRESYAITATLEVRKGLGLFNATKKGEVSASGYTPSRFDGDPQATVLRGDLAGTVGLGSIFTLAARAHGQWANEALLNFEEYSIGNFTIGRGYKPVREATGSRPRSAAC